MPSISALRRSPHFAHLFAHVHPLCWPILLWSLARLFKWFDTAGFENVLYSTSRWGFIRIAYLGDKKADPAAYKPLERTFRPLTDDSWGTSLPAELTNELAAPCALILPCEAGGGGMARSAMTEGAFQPTLSPNTS